MMPPYHGDNDFDLAAGCCPAYVIGDLGLAAGVGADKIGTVHGLVEGNSKDLDQRLGADVHDGGREVGRPGLAHVSLARQRLCRCSERRVMHWGCGGCARG